MAAEKIRDTIGPELVELHNLKDDSPALMADYDVLILGIPTWDFGEIQEDWDAVWDKLDHIDLEGKSSIVFLQNTTDLFWIAKVPYLLL